MAAIRAHEFISLDGVFGRPAGPMGSASTLRWARPSAPSPAMRTRSCSGARRTRCSRPPGGTAPRRTTRAPFFNDTEKLVVGRRDLVEEWSNTTPFGAYDAERLRELRTRGGAPIYHLGQRAAGPGLIADGLLDELHLFVYPIALGTGRAALRGPPAWTWSPTRLRERRAAPRPPSARLTPDAGRRLSCSKDDDPLRPAVGHADAALVLADAADRRSPRPPPRRRRPAGGRRPPEGHVAQRPTSLAIAAGSRGRWSGVTKLDAPAANHCVRAAAASRSRSAHRGSRRRSHELAPSSARILSSTSDRPTKNAVADFEVDGDADVVEALHVCHGSTLQVLSCRVDRRTEPGLGSRHGARAGAAPAVDRRRWSSVSPVVELVGGRVCRDPAAGAPR